MVTTCRKFVETGMESANRDGWLTQTIHRLG
jgi:hypothetical protein